jgi:hypothetical protein
VAARSPIPLAPVSTPSIQLDAWARDSGRYSEIDRIGGAADAELLDVRNAAPGTSDYGMVTRPIPGNEVAGVGIGAAGDAEATVSGSVIAILKRLRTLLNGGLPALVGGKLPVDAAGTTLTVAGSVGIDSLPNEGQQTMANSISVAIASNQSAVPISGTVTATATDLDIRNLSSGQDSVTVVGAVTVSGTATVSGTVSLKSDQVASAPLNVAVAATDALVIAANASRTGLYLKNVSTAGQRVSLAFDGQVSVLDRGYTLEVGDAFVMDQNDFTLGAVNAIASAGSAALAAQEWA